MAVEFPSNPTNGQTWDGWIYDSSLPGWRNANAPGAAPKTGLAPVAPTSVTVVSGTASANQLGTVTFSGATSISLDGVFSSLYKNYRVVLTANIVTTERWLELRLRSGGANITTNNYAYTVRRFENSGSASTDNSGQTSALFSIAGPTVNGQSFTFDVNSPNASSVTNWFGQSESIFSGGLFNMAVFGGMFTGTTAMTGFTITPQAESISGTVTVYGYNN